MALHLTMIIFMSLVVIALSCSLPGSIPSSLLSLPLVSSLVTVLSIRDIVTTIPSFGAFVFSRMSPSTSPPPSMLLHPPQSLPLLLFPYPSCFLPLLLRKLPMCLPPLLLLIPLHLLYLFLLYILQSDCITVVELPLPLHLTRSLWLLPLLLIQPLRYLLIPTPFVIVPLCFRLTVLLS